MIEPRHIQITESTTLAELQVHMAKAGVEYISTRANATGTLVGLQVSGRTRFVFGNGTTIAEAINDAFRKLTNLTVQELAKL